MRCMQKQDRNLGGILLTYKKILKYLWNPVRMKNDKCFYFGRKSKSSKSHEKRKHSGASVVAFAPATFTYQGPYKVSTVTSLTATSKPASPVPLAPSQ